LPQPEPHLTFWVLQGLPQGPLLEPQYQKQLPFLVLLLPLEPQVLQVQR